MRGVFESSVRFIGVYMSSFYSFKRSKSDLPLGLRSRLGGVVVMGGGKVTGDSVAFGVETTGMASFVETGLSLPSTSAPSYFLSPAL